MNISFVRLLINDVFEFEGVEYKKTGARTAKTMFSEEKTYFGKRAKCKFIMHKKEIEEVPVIFRKFEDGDVIAFFPTEIADTNVFNCQSYMHLGQHSAASTDLMTTLDKCTEEEYSSLFKELRNIYEGNEEQPEKLIVKDRNHSSYLMRRKKKLYEVK